MEKDGENDRNVIMTCELLTDLICVPDNMHFRFYLDQSKYRLFCNTLFTLLFASESFCKSGFHSKGSGNGNRKCYILIMYD